jgi:phosphate starvation-inducible PhoH-like protein
MLDRLVELAGREESVNSQKLRSIYASLESGDDADVEAFRENVIRIPGGARRIYPRSMRQTAYIRQMSSRDLVFSIGPAGTGKTFLAVAHALMELLSRKKRKIVLTRPVVETGENLGFLPGDLTQKLAPYLRPLYDAMEDLVDSELLERLRNNGQLEVAPMAYMRGRSLKNCYIVLDEAQNTTIEQMKMFLTRLGEGSRAVVTGDITQVDLPSPGRSGLADAVKVLQHVEDIALTEFTSDDVVRHPLVKKIIDAYENYR